MKIESASFGNLAQPSSSAPAEAVERQRKPGVMFDESSRDEKKISPEELLDKIKALTEDGLYSVRFEKDKDLDKLIIKLVERKSGDLIRQIPPDELLGTAKALRDFRGAIIKTEG